MSISLNFTSLLAAPNLDHLLAGIKFTGLLTVASWLLAFVLGVALATLRVTGNPVAERGVAAWVSYQQNVPILAHLFLWYFGIPTLLPDAAQSWINGHNGELIFASIAIGLCMSAYFCEDVRSGLRAVPPGQQEASRSLGLSFLKTMRFVVLPQAMRTALPPFINHTIILFKNTSLAMALGAAELTYVVREIENQTFRTFEAYTLATAFYLLVSLGLMGVGVLVARRMQVPGR
ncbi:amino acid ABC transporter permease [Variovorax sp. efr-133-TYG-130]|uniref:amino acid ABC transporter permease n=1 Tax=Variovorax sp. efr-133-TYG-130 TaxID=3040327 RepID=UPI002556943C|nr:amino acid ABC transporter permease [Variovorax sp. efr-133-TYG-130]